MERPRFLLGSRWGEGSRSRGSSCPPPQTTGGISPKKNPFLLAFLKKKKNAKKMCKKKAQKFLGEYMVTTQLPTPLDSFPGWTLAGSQTCILPQYTLAPKHANLPERPGRAPGRAVLQVLLLAVNLLHRDVLPLLLRHLSQPRDHRVSGDVHHDGRPQHRPPGASPLWCVLGGGGSTNPPKNAPTCFHVSSEVSSRKL